jgi:hypothetical protein
MESSIVDKRCNIGVTAGATSPLKIADRRCRRPIVGERNRGGAAAGGGARGRVGRGG